MELKHAFKGWWKEQAVVTGENKLDFYYKYKKTFGYEKYLDNIPKQIRMFLTRLRISSHNLPIEIQRYNKDEKGQKIKREKRKCTICTLNEVGDEDHYLLRCNNNKIENIRKTLLREVKAKVRQLELFNDKNIMDYCMSMSDQNLHMPVALYVKNLLKIYKEETELPEVRPIPISKTRAGRVVRKPNKLNL